MRFGIRSIFSHYLMSCHSAVISSDHLLIPRLDLSSVPLGIKPPLEHLTVCWCVVSYRPIFSKTDWLCLVLLDERWWHHHHCRNSMVWAFLLWLINKQFPSSSGQSTDGSIWISYLLHCFTRSIIIFYSDAGLCSGPIKSFYTSRKVTCVKSVQISKGAESVGEAQKLLGIRCHRIHIPPPSICNVQ